MIATIADEYAEELIGLLNKALAMEHAAAIQYRQHAEQISGPMSEPIIARLQEQAKDETGHAETLCNLIGDYLLGVPASNITAVKEVDDELKQILDANLESENEAIDQYKKILSRINALKNEIAPIYEKLEHDIRHILIDEMEHIAELSRLK